MAVVDTFRGRCSPFTGAPVVVELMRQFDSQTLQDTWAIKFSSGSIVEEYSGLTHNAAIARWKQALAWWE